MHHDPTNLTGEPVHDSTVLIGEPIIAVLFVPTGQVALSVDGTLYGVNEMNTDPPAPAAISVAINAFRTALEHLDPDKRPISR